MVKYDRPPLATIRAKTMRRASTDAELKLWFLLRDRRLEGWKFRRQVPIGPYIADLVCQRSKHIVEADGAQHALSQRDVDRDAWFMQRGYRIVRYNNLDILQNSEGVLTDLLLRLDSV